ncbi:MULTISPECIES: sensor histidine kinase [Streptomyces]|uniref:histidine kinase n=1 Tax=Streptomyces bobili TaxID=67280 RepID=A0ABZ1QS83_9ACTN|nr:MULTISPECIES: histidine kinase [Streptomyces]QEU70558.1 sensor histidine kinase [Streptomyces galilaeus]GGW42595.1 two-component sensor histidine kinase [Streptomyces galilaeus]
MSTTWQRRAASHTRAVEAAGLALLLAVTLCGVLVTRWVTNDSPPDLLPGIALSVLACAALHLRRSHPLPVLALTALCAMAEGLLGYLLTPLLMGPLLVAQYSTSLLTSRRTTWASALVTAAGMAVSGLFLTTFQHALILSSINPAAWVLMVAAFGSYVRVRREYAAARAEHAAQEREEEARRRVIEERMRIARELHDVVAHHLALANAQAGTAAHLAVSNPEQAFEIVARLPETTAAALRELKATVGLLRQDTDPDDEIAPAPGLGQLPDLVRTCSAAGLDVAVAVEGEPRRLTPGLDLTAYRIIQEALTNVTKHAVTRAARVRLAYTPHHLTLTITNDAPDIHGTAARRSPAESGFGLLGMRERALSTGGTFHAGPRPDGGFDVTCALPLNNADSTDSTGSTERPDAITEPDGYDDNESTT